LKDKLALLADVRDRSFCTGLVYGVIERKLQLDFLIAAVSSTPFKKIHIVNKNILRMGLYQIIYMNVPVSAACNTSVNLAKKNGQVRSSGFVNAVLRKLALRKDDISLPTGDDVESLSVRYSVDPTIIDLLLKQTDISFVKEYFDSLEKLPPDETTIAVNLLKTDSNFLADKLEKEGVTVVGGSKDLLSIKFSLNISALPSFRSGLFHVIGRPSYITADALDVQPGQTVIDLCSAPGGKTFALAYKMKNMGRIIAADVRPDKVNAMKREAERLGITNIKFLCADATEQITNWKESADRVLCDVPCSGLGIIRKKPDIRYKNMNGFDLMNVQSKILENGMFYLKKSGMLVYSTCTVNPAENQGIVAPYSKCMLKDKVFLPQIDYTEGFYYSLLKKQ